MSRSFKRTPIVKLEKFSKADKQLSNKSFRRKLNRGQFDELLTSQNNLYKHSGLTRRFKNYWPEKKVIDDLHSRNEFVKHNNNSPWIPITVYTLTNEMNFENKETEYIHAYQGFNNFEEYKEWRINCWKACCLRK